MVDSFLAFFDTGWLPADDPSERRFLVEVASEAAVEVVGGLHSLELHRFGVGGGAWFKIGSIPVPHVSHSPPLRKLGMCLPSTINLRIVVPSHMALSDGLTSSIWRAFAQWSLPEGSTPLGFIPLGFVPAG